MQVPFFVRFALKHRREFFNFGGGRLMRIARRSAVVLAALSVCTVASVANAGKFTPTNNREVANAVVLQYEPTDGHLLIDGNGRSMTTFELKSAGSLLKPEAVPAGTLAPPFDVGTSAKIFKLSTGGFPSLDLGRALPSGLSLDALVADLDVNGSLLPAGPLTSAEGGGPYIYYVPEPSSLLLVCCGLLGLAGLRRK
jgi:hypothetical protein